LRPAVLVIPSIDLRGGRVVRLLRGTMLDVLHADYIRTARAKGL